MKFNPLSLTLLTGTLWAVTITSGLSQEPERSLLLITPELTVPELNITKERDPFISSDVKVPYVTLPDQPFSERRQATPELVKFINSALTEAIIESIKIYGVSHGGRGPGYTLVNGQTYKVGDTMNIPLTSQSLITIQEAALLAKEEGFILDIGIDLGDAPATGQGAAAAATPQNTAPTGQSLDVLLKDINNRTLKIFYPITQEDLKIPFKRDLSVLPTTEGTGEYQPDSYHRDRK